MRAGLAEVFSEAASAAGDGEAAAGGARTPQVLSRFVNDFVSISLLRAGMRISHDIYDQSGVLLLAAGIEITPRFLYLLQQRQIRFVRLQPARRQKAGEPGIRRLREPRPIEADGSPPASEAAGARPQLPPAELWHEARRGLQKHIGASCVLAGIADSLQNGQPASGDEMRELVADFADMLTLDADLLATVVSMQQVLGEYLFDHCVNVSLLSMAIGNRLGLSREHILEIGLGGVFQDIGMLRVPRRIRLAPRRLTPDEWREIRFHPVYTLDCLERVRGLTATAKFIGYQAHERLDGSGYPRGRSAITTHPFAKIIAVADAYAAMTRPRPHRAPIPPHQAVRQLLVEGSQGRLDRSLLRAFLDAMSVTPVGSLVELSNGLIARVLRANPGLHTRPVLVVTHVDGSPTDEVLDLSKMSEVKVVRALDGGEPATADPPVEPIVAPAS